VDAILQAEKKMTAAAITFPKIRDPYFGPIEFTVSKHRSLPLGLISLVTPHVILVSGHSV